jgi:cell wall integrity and stress response component
MVYKASRWRANTLAALLVFASHVSADLTQTYCSNQNTGSGYANVDNSIYQSNGRCHDTCIANYAFAVVQGDNCWCSNYIPSNQQSVSKCNEACPGYPSESCGSSSGLFGYIALNVKPSGTAGASSSSAKSSSTSSAGRISSSSVSPYSKPATKTTVKPVVVETTVTEESSLYTTPVFASSPTTSAADTVNSPLNSPSVTGTPVTSVQIITQSGQVVTQTITTTPTAGSSSAMLGKEKSQSIAPGYIVAAVIASVAGIILLCLAFFWIWRRRKIVADSEKYGDGNVGGSGSPADLNRNTSVNSKAGLLDSAYPPTLTTRFSTHNLDLSTGTSSPNSTGARRKSNPLDFDQRLNPNLLMVHDNGSHNSIQTLEDHRDYGRMLKVTNPDPRKSFS